MTASNEPQERDSNLSGVIKDEIVLIGFLILFVGIISTDAYYHTFGINYQFLNLPPSHIIYRALTILFDAPYLLIPYLIAISWMMVNNYAALRGWRMLVKFRVQLSYLLILLLLIATYPLAGHAGRKQANLDLHEQTTTLPRIINLELSNGERYGPEEKLRLLMVDSDYIVVFAALNSNANATVPNIKRLSKGDVHVIETIR
jgi:hypothetical protein